MLEVERLAGPGVKVQVSRSCCGYVASVFRDGPLLYFSRDGDTRLEALDRLHGLLLERP